MFTTPSPDTAAPSVARLMARLVAASAGARELDGKIWAVIDEAAFKRQCSFKGRKHAGRIYTAAEKRHHETRMGAVLAPRYTTSLDNALTLVPEGWHIKIQICYNVGAERAYCHCDLERDCYTAGRDLGDDEPMEIQTAPPALCIAALKARAALAKASPPIVASQTGTASNTDSSPEDGR